MMKFGPVLVTALLALAPSPLSAANLRPDLADISQDWTPISPRVQCLEAAGLKQGSNQTYKPVPDVDLSLPSDREISENIRLLRPENLRQGGEAESYVFRLSVLLHAAGKLAAAPRPDLRKISAILAAIESTPIPDVGKRRFEVHQALVKRECAAEYFAVAFGIGKPQGVTRFKRTRELWVEDPEKWKPDGRVTFYTRPLVALNYLVARELLAEGRPKEAFAIANSDVMRLGFNEVPYGSHFLASFHQLGIGTPRSLETALAIFQKADDKVEAASVKARMGRRAEAIADLRAFMAKEWSEDLNYKRANILYTQLTGSAYIEPPKPGFIDAVMMIPLAVLSYCANIPGGCTTSQPGDSSSVAGNQPWKAQENAARNHQQWNDWTSIGKPDY